MPKEKQPDIRYLRQVPLIRANIFTMSQVILTVVLCVARGTSAVVVFPVLVSLGHFVMYRKKLTLMKGRFIINFCEKKYHSTH